MRLSLERRRNGTTMPYDEPCGCCGEPMIKPHLDHDHKTGQIREWLGSRCNHMLGTARDNPRECVRFAMDNQRRAEGSRNNREAYEERTKRWLDASVYLIRHGC